jgi:hypothetical protein
MMQALHGLGWIHEMEKRGYQKFLDNRVHDTF